VAPSRFINAVTDSLPYQQRLVEISQQVLFWLEKHPTAAVHMKLLPLEVVCYGAVTRELAQAMAQNPESLELLELLIERYQVTVMQIDLALSALVILESAAPSGFTPFELERSTELESRLRQSGLLVESVEPFTKPLDRA
jgi:hypothetical protein